MVGLDVGVCGRRYGNNLAGGDGYKCTVVEYEGVLDAVAGILAYKLTLSAVHVEQQGSRSIGYQPALVG